MAASDPASRGVDPSAVPSALERLEELRARLAGRRLALFLDYDGTLTEIVERPEDAVLPERRRRLLRGLARHAALAIVSGRDLADVKARVAIPELAYAGSHGLDIEGPPGSGIREELAEDHRAELDAAERELAERLGEIPGAQVERKRYSVAAHTRRAVGEGKARVRRAVGEVLARHPRLRLKEGHEVQELLPAIDWDKGRAVLRLLEALHLAGDDVLAVYVGDDQTDEDAFRALAARDRAGGGLGILVSAEPRPTAATWRLRDPAAVERWLAALSERLG